LPWNSGLAIFATGCRAIGRQPIGPHGPRDVLEAQSPTGPKDIELARQPDMTRSGDQPYL
jgi:hypothetical protein